MDPSPPPSVFLSRSSLQHLSNLEIARGSAPYPAGDKALRNSEIATRSPSMVGTAASIRPFDGIDDAEVVSPASFPRARRREEVLFWTMCGALFLAGWNDASAGPLLPRMQDTYNIGYIIVSLIFVCNCAGFIFAAFVNVWLTDKFGFGKVVLGGVALQAVAYSIQSIQPPFPLMAASYTIAGFGLALQDSQANALVASLPTRPDAKLSILHGVYGIGAFAAPLIATQFSQIQHWGFYFLTSLGVSVACFVSIFLVCGFKTQDELLGELDVQPAQVVTGERSKMNQILRLKAVHLVAVFLLIYVGVEVTIGGWIVTFLLRQRGAGPSAGYVASGFFAGVAIGRFALIWVNRKLGVKGAIYAYGALAIALEATVWFVPSLYENAIAIAFVGLVLGPFYPIVMEITSIVVPRRLLTGSIGWIASIGQIGSAAFPFVLAVMAEKHGVQVLQPFMVAMLATLPSLWFFVPITPRHAE